MENIIKFKVFGFTDEVTTCDCCGKANLSGTFAVEMIETGEILYYGSVCVTRNTGIKNPMTAANRYEQERTKLAQIELLQSAEHRAKEAVFARRQVAKIAIGRPSADYVRTEWEAFDRKVTELKEKYKIPSLFA